VAGLLIDLAADPRQPDTVATVTCPLAPAAQALGVSTRGIITALHAA
jgi:hypothetical protein